jgi:phenylalanyl-tRNA synthetase beta chain
MLNLSLRFLQQQVPGLPADAASVAARLQAAGYTVARTDALAELLRPVVAGRVEAVTQHPNADRLKVCTVDDGSDTRLQIVTGAANVVAGGYYPVIRGGTTLPNGTRIKRGKLRGEVSEGMLGSADELELGSDHDGLYTLSGQPVPGTPLPEVIPVEGTVFVLEGNPEIEEVLSALRK